MHNSNFGILSEMYRKLCLFFRCRQDLNHQCRQNRCKNHSKQSPKAVTGINRQQGRQWIKAQLLASKPGFQHRPQQRYHAINAQKSHRAQRIALQKADNPPPTRYVRLKRQVMAEVPRFGLPLFQVQAQGVSRLHQGDSEYRTGYG